MENKHKLSINQWAIEDRPREKMMEKGAAALSDAELLAILIGSGNTEESAVELMRRLLLSCDNNLNSLAKWEVCDYSRFKGMGPAKSITVMAALELGKRRKLQNTKERLRISCSKDIYDIFQPVMCDLEQEEFWVLLLNQWAIEDRPREKMMEKGAAALSDAELLAILIGSGNTEESAVELMRRLLLSCDNNLNSLAKWEVCDYSRFKGMGPAKSITVMAALELGKRRKLQNTKERLRISCSKDIYDIFQPVMCDLEQEEFWVLLLNQATRLIDKVRISTGGIDGTYTDVRTILREALLQRATQIAVVHNHPSGNIQPSQPDRTLTEHIRQAADTMNIHLIDHVIVCEDKFYSFADEGLL